MRGLMLWCVFRCRSSAGWKDTRGVGERRAAHPQLCSQHDWKYVTGFSFFFFFSCFHLFCETCVYIVIYHISNENIMLIYNTLVLVVSYFTVLSLIC